MALSKSDDAQSKGPLWSHYKDIPVGRIVCRPSDGRKGVITFPKFHTFNGAMATSYMVRWSDSPGFDDLESVPTSDTAEWMKDEFANMDIVPSAILDYQENNWHKLPEGFVPKRPPPSSIYKDVPEALKPSTTGQPSVKEKTSQKRSREQTTQAAPPTSAPARANASVGRSKDVKAKSGTASAGKGAKGKGTAPPAPTASTGGGSGKSAGGTGEDGAGHESTEEDEEAGPSTAGNARWLLDAVEAADADMKKQEGKTVRSYSTGTKLPAHLCLLPGDKRLTDITEDEGDGDYVVECILDELDEPEGKKTRKMYLVKWKGYELNLGSEGEKGDWEPEKNLKGTAALVAWKKEKPAWWLAQQGKQEAGQRSHKKARSGR